MADAKEATAKGTLLGSLAHGHAAPERSRAPCTTWSPSSSIRHELGRRSEEAVSGRCERQVERPEGRRRRPAPPQLGEEPWRSRRAWRGSGPLHGLASEHLPKLVLAPTFVITLFFVYGFILWTTFLSFTSPASCRSCTGWPAAIPAAVGQPRWWTSLENLAIFAVLYIGLATLIGLLLAILLDQKIRGEGVLRTIYLYPMALSFIVTGTAWKWLLNPGIGLEKIVHDWGFTSFTLDWIIQPRHGDLLHRDRGDLAVQRLRHGDVPGRPARRRRRDRQGGADRRCVDLQSTGGSSSR